MILLGVNGIPTSGQIRDSRKQLGRQLGPAAGALLQGVILLAGTGEPTVSLMRHRGQRRVEQVLSHPGMHQLVGTIATAGRAATASLEHASDEAHDALEEQLARLNSWPRTLLGYLSPARYRGA
jgi:hypothetical protein